ncbi:putative ribosome-binding factor A, mitochondrial isoform X1 [Ambystoma mexicanum]|uniref:putative ribosome-binding factor A, mitochondrial isoform X1 n=2 Tax=Ambystoma mexicanum TaxID=8296 RepID=UPI0037E9C53B
MALCCSRGALLVWGATCSAKHVHTTATLNAKKTLLMKFASKTKKKFWYAGPSVGSQLMNKPPSFLSSLKTSQTKTRKEDSIRLRALNAVLYKAVTDLMNTCEVSHEIHDLRVEVTKVALACDFSACRVYWKTTGDAETDDHSENILMRDAPRIRHLLITHHVIGSVPPVVFVKDRQHAAVSEIEKLLAIADFGPDVNDDPIPSQSDFSDDSAAPATSSSKLSNLFGIDHEELNKQITEYKKRSPQMELEPVSKELTEQLAELRKQKVLQRKMKERKNSIYEDDITPQKYLLDKYSDDELDNVLSTEHALEDELHEELDELEAEEQDIPPEEQKSRSNK